MRRYAAGGIGAVILISALSAARADVPMSGTFQVTHACAAYQSIRKGTNPGAVTVEPNRVYKVLAGNMPSPTHYRILVEGAQPPQRWVSAACGTVAAVDTRPGTATGAPQPQAVGGSGARATHVLAIGWEAAFCARHTDKSECRDLTSASFAGTHFSLHGLWPQPRGYQYCNVPAELAKVDRAHQWEALPEPQMSAGTLKRLAAVMPGVQSKLQRHLWIVHGTCFGGNPDGYFNRAAGLAEAVNGSKVQQLFAENIGRNLSAAAIRAAFDDAFGAGAGARVTVSCGGKGGNRKITELVLSLAGDVTGSAALPDLLKAAQPVPVGCPGGVVDRAPR